MTGSKKQRAWAYKIRGRFLAETSTLAQDIRESGRVAFAAFVSEKLAEIAAWDDAAKWIENRAKLTDRSRLEYHLWVAFTGDSLA